MSVTFEWKKKPYFFFHSDVLLLQKQRLKNLKWIYIPMASIDSEATWTKLFLNLFILGNYLLFFGNRTSIITLEIQFRIVLYARSFISKRLLLFSVFSLETFYFYTIFYPKSLKKWLLLRVFSDHNSCQSQLWRGVTYSYVIRGKKVSFAMETLEIVAIFTMGKMTPKRAFNLRGIIWKTTLSERLLAL